MNNMYIKEYSDFTKSIVVEQMHDEIVNEICCTSSSVTLKFNKLHFQHFNKSFKSAEMIFSDIDDVYSDVNVELYKMEKLKIYNGEKLYMDDFHHMYSNKTISFEVLDLFIGYQSFLICGNLIDFDMKEYNKIRLSISSKTLKYCFY